MKRAAQRINISLMQYQQLQQLQEPPTTHWTKLLQKHIKQGCLNLSTATPLTPMTPMTPMTPISPMTPKNQITTPITPLISMSLILPLKPQFHSSLSPSSEDEDELQQQD